MSGHNDDVTPACTPTVHVGREIATPESRPAAAGGTTEVKQTRPMNDLLLTRDESRHDDERRSEERWVAVKPAKVYDRRADRYFTAQTCNLSQGGALLKIVRSMPIAAGDPLTITIGEAAEGPVVAQDQMVESKVIRVIPMDPYTQAVAVQYKQANHETADLIPTTRKPTQSVAAA
ncbi:MAG: PilZ domain-containing protein [Planctomycetes bacterium]|nr:PilZ domain-containing protein [Planctomycetota bacterium]NOG54047.1 PilZ domain-containing protein [Planctomycetota bacterium]